MITGLDGFDIQDVLVVLDFATVFSSILVGIIVGVLYFPHLFIVKRNKLIAPLSLFFIGVSFMVMLGGVRYLERMEEWERWLGISILWALFCIGSHVGLELEYRFLRKDKDKT